MKTFTTTDKIRNRLQTLIHTGWVYIAINEQNSTIWINARTSQRAANIIEARIDSDIAQATDAIEDENIDGSQRINIYRAVISNHKIMDMKWIADYLEPRETTDERAFSHEKLAREFTPQRATRRPTASRKTR